ncbi:MAG: hypothetical protein WBC59_10600, partial [Phycisphaerae bacterium]
HNTVAYVAKQGDKSFVVRRNQQGRSFDDINRMCFTANGQHFAYSAKTGEEWCVVVDGQTGPKRDLILAGPGFRDDGSVEYLAVHKDRLWKEVLNKKRASR